MRFGFWVCIVISIGAVLRRLVALAGFPRTSQAEYAALDGVFSSHAALTCAHILPALVFVLLAPFVMLRRTPRFSWADRLLYPLGASVGVTAYAMSSHAVGGWLERSAVLVFDTVFLVSLGRAWLYRRNCQSSLERRWLVRAVVVLLGIATTRPVMGIFFATARMTHLQPSQFFGMAFWIGFTINALAVELWLRRTEPGSQLHAKPFA